ncbi:glutathione synthetase-like [Bolinopsis microptera]|uniref:glutathione synthetase-like n=1 Tax=Bolinopsis microptera TaxID=2820187 RepID=UPI00307A03C3
MMFYLTPVAEYDSFVKGLLDIYSSLPDSHSDKITLALNRHDFMYEVGDIQPGKSPTFKLVEFNLVAASLGGLSEGVCDYHSTLLNQYNMDISRYHHKVNIIQGYSDGLRLGYELYREKYSCSGNCVVVMINQTDDTDHQFNYFDQQLILNALERAAVPTKRYSARYLAAHGTTKNGRYMVEGKEVAMVYFRTLYDPRHFKSDDIWRLRRDLELSAAITVPCVRHQLVNTKLFQMVLTQRSVLDRYTPSSAVTDKILELFCETLHLNPDVEGDKNAQLGIDHPDGYVMKPQREGGGHNIWEEEMREKLLSLSGDPARAQYILMKRITAPRRKNKIVRRGVMSERFNTVSEFGCFSVYCTDGAGIVKQNKTVGPLIRTKVAGENEGGVGVGIAAIDSPYFV